MPVSEKERTTPQSIVSKQESSSQPMPAPQEFQEQLRALAQSAVRAVIELVMREELDAFIGAAWGECSPQRKGSRNGTYTRDLVTARRDQSPQRPGGAVPHPDLRPLQPL